MRPQPKTDGAHANPGVEVDDEVFVDHASGPRVGRVIAHGKHGATIDIDGEQHRVPWARVLGAKKRAEKRYTIIDEGEDGMIVEDASGKRRFLHVEPDARTDRMVVKAFGGHRIVRLTKAEAGG